MSARDWPWARLDEVAAVTAGNPAPQGQALFEGGSRPFVRVQDLGRLLGAVHLTETADRVNERAAASLRLFPKGSILFTKSGASLLLNQRAILSRDMHVVSHIGVAVPGPRVTSEWLYYWLRTVDFADIAHGANMPSLPLSRVKQMRVPVPQLVEQQERVREIEKQFSRLDEAIINLKRTEANLKHYRTAVLKAAVEGRLVPTEAELAADEDRTFESGAQLLDRILESRRRQWSARGRYIEPQNPGNAVGHSLPIGWVWTTAEQISDFITKGTTPSATKLARDAGEVQFIKVYNLTFDGSLNYHYKPAFIDRQTHSGELARSKVRQGDVLMNIVGPPLGQVSIVPESLGEANINQAIARLRPIEPLSAKFLAITLMSEDIMQWAIRRAKTTAGQANLTLELCRALPLPLPPLSEQDRIVAEVERRLSLVREIERQVTANLLRAISLRRGVLSRAFACKEQHA